MSGKAVTHPVRRITNEELRKVQHEVTRWLWLSGIPHALPTHLTSKQDHGDVDVIVGQVSTDIRLPEKVKGVNRRPGFVHMAWPLEDGTYVQVDLILVEPEWLDMARVYYSHGTLSNHIGLMCRFIGLMFGYQGLRRKIYDPVTEHSCGDINVTTNPVNTLTLLGLDAASIDRIVNGSFATREESYAMLLKFPCFYKQAISLDRMSAANRTREAKRPETSNLIAWLEEQNLHDEGLPMDFKSRMRLMDKWYFTLFPNAVYKALNRMAQLSLDIQMEARKHVPDWKNEWVRSYAKLGGIHVEEAGRLINQRAAAKELKFQDFMKTFTPEEAVYQLPQNMKIENTKGDRHLVSKLSVGGYKPICGGRNKAEAIKNAWTLTDNKPK